jgi:hypothetical protein
MTLPEASLNDKVAGTGLPWICAHAGAVAMG